MAFLNLTSSPALISPAGNDIIIKVTGNKYSSAGAYASIALICGAIGIVNDPVKLVIAGITYTWTGVASVTDYTSQFKVDAGYSTDQQMDSILASIKSVNEITENYNFGTNYATASRLVIIAKEKGDTWDITRHADTFAGLTGSANSGTNPTLIDNYKINLRLLLISLSDSITITGYTGTYNILTEIGADSITPDSASLARFNIAEYLKPYLSSAFTFDDLMLEMTDFIKKFRFQYWKSSGIPSVDGEMAESSDFYAINSALSKEFEANLNAQEISFYEYLNDNGNRVLNWAPAVKYIPENSNVEFFSFINYSNATSIKFNIRFRYTDNTQEIITIANFPCEQYKAYCLRIDIYYLLNFIANKTVNYFYVNIVDQSDAYIILTATTKYYIDYNFKNLPEQNIILFKNSLGGYDTVYCSGNKTEMLKYSGEEFSTSIEDIQPMDGEVSVYNKQENEQKTIHTGYLKEGYKEWLRDLLLSDEVYYIDRLDYNFNIYKIISLTGEFQKHQTNNFLENLQLDCKLAFTNQFYSDEPNYNTQVNLAINGTFNSSLWGWSQINGDWSWDSNGKATYPMNVDEISCLYQSILESGNYYRIMLDLVIDTYSAGRGIQIQCGTKNAATFPIAEDESNSIIFDTTRTIDIELYANGSDLSIQAYDSEGTFLTIDNVKVYKV